MQKKCLLDFNEENLQVIFGGDFNSGLPGEKLRNNKILAPEFLNVTMNSGPTVDTRYAEPVILANKVAGFIGKLGLYIRMKVDHIYADKKMAEQNKISCKVFPNRISDHSAMEIVVTNR